MIRALEQSDRQREKATDVREEETAPPITTPANQLGLKATLRKIFQMFADVGIF